MCICVRTHTGICCILNMCLDAYTCIITDTTHRILTENAQENPWRTTSNHYNKKVLEVTRTTSRLHRIRTECYCRAKMNKFFSTPIRTMDIKNILNIKVNGWVGVEEKNKRKRITKSTSQQDCSERTEKFKQDTETRQPEKKEKITSRDLKL